MKQKFLICKHCGNIVAMIREHYIEWICLESEHGIQYAHLDPGDEPRAKFALCEGDEVRAVYAFCNQHDLWRN